MLNRDIRILDLDGSIVKQTGLTGRFHTDIVDMRSLGPKARFRLSDPTKDKIQEKLGASAKNSLTFLGSGDFHHVSNILINQYNEPISVIGFDFHPDWDILPPRLGCGSWVTETLKNNNILKFVLAGVSSDDISSLRIQTGNLASLKNDRVEIYSYSHPPSLVMFKEVPRNTSIDIARNLFWTKIYWNELKGKDVHVIFTDIIKRIPTKSVYISIDKDCLIGDHALTNWEEGYMKLEELLSILRLIKENLDIVGADVVGDYSDIHIEGRLKSALSYLDHPRRVRANAMTDDAITRINESTNIRIAELMTSQ